MMADEPKNDNKQQGQDDGLADNPDALNADFQAPQNDIDPVEIKRSFADRVKGVTSNFNVYLIAFLVTVGALVAPLVRDRITRISDPAPALAAGIRTLAFVVIIALVLVYLRPIDQFIYFQF